jgi:citrate/tricarballylate utilization protein
MLFFNGLTGLALLGLRETPAMGALLAIHLGFVFALFLSFPYGKFVHGFYRYAALARFAAEARAAAMKRRTAQSEFETLRKIPL